MDERKVDTTTMSSRAQALAPYRGGKSQLRCRVREEIKNVLTDALLPKSVPVPAWPYKNSSIVSIGVMSRARSGTYLETRSLNDRRGC